MSEIINRPEKPRKKQRNYDYIIPGLRDMIEFAAAKTVGPRDVPSKIAKLMGYKTPGGYTMKFVDLKDEVPKELEHFGISKENLYDFVRILNIPFNFFYRFNIYDKNDGELSENSLIDLLEGDTSAEKNKLNFEKLVIEFWEGFESASGYQNLAQIAEKAKPARHVSIGSPGDRGVAIIKEANTPPKIFEYGDVDSDPYVIKVKVDQGKWFCALMELKDDPYIMPSFVMIHGPELARVDDEGELFVSGEMGPPNGRYRILTFLFDPKLEMTGWADVSAGSGCSNELVNEIVRSVIKAPESCYLMISNPYEARRRPDPR